MDRAGASRGDFARNETQYGQVVPSPDGARVAVTSFTANGTDDLWIHDVARGSRSRFTFTPGVDRHAVWSPDGTVLAFAGFGAGGNAFTLHRKTIDGATEAALLGTSDVLRRPFSWSPDGKLIAFGQEGDIWLLPLDGPEEPYAFTESEAREIRSAFTPDGRWMAYQSNDSGRDEVYVTPFPGPGRRWQVSTDGGHHPWWRRDGREILYQKDDGTVAAAEVEVQGDTIVVVARARLFDAPPPAVNTVGFSFAPMPDAQRFLIARRLPAEPASLSLVVNWTAALDR